MAQSGCWISNQLWFSIKALFRGKFSASLTLFKHCARGKNEEHKYICLTVEQIEEYHKEFPNMEEIDINVPADKRGQLINSQSLDKLISILKGKTET